MAPPDEYGLAHDVVFRHEAPIAGVGGVVPVVAHHPIIVHLEGVAVRQPTIDVYLPILHLQVVAFVYLDATLIDGDVLQG